MAFAGVARADAAMSAAPPRAWGAPVGRLADAQREQALAEFGRQLFFDPRLSANGCKSCASCHQPEHAFSDGLARASGVYGDLHGRNTPTLTNVAYAASFTASDAGIDTLEAQMLLPLFNAAPPEMGLTRETLPAALARLDADERYAPLRARAFGDGSGALSLADIQAGLAAFQRTLVSFESPFDRYVFAGDGAALPPAAQRGMQLFFSRKLACAACHSGWNYSGPVRTAAPAAVADARHAARAAATAAAPAPPAVAQRFHGMGFAPDATAGATEFKAPTLRNIALTAPYMHDGSLATLEDVIRHYEKGGGEGRSRSSLLRKFTLTSQERADLVAFLNQLTDTRFIARSSAPPPFAVPAAACGAAVAQDRAGAAAASTPQ